MERRSVKALTPGGKVDAEIFFSTAYPAKVEVKLDTGRSYEAVDDDLYEALVAIRLEAEREGVTILCKGSRVDVHTSPMSRSMSSGALVYQLSGGEKGSGVGLVNIFDPTDQELVGTVE